jgi:hypothetical protein
MRRTRPEGDGEAEGCAECGAQSSVIYIGRRLQRGHWSDIPGARLCAKCFAERAALRPDQPAQPDQTERAAGRRPVEARLRI